MKQSENKGKMKVGWYFLVALVILLIQPFLVHLFLKIPAPCDFFVRYWNAGDLITYIAGFEAFCGTVFLGIVARQQNERSIKAAEDANSLSETLVSIEKIREREQREPVVILKSIDFVNYVIMKPDSENNLIPIQEIQPTGDLTEFLNNNSKDCYMTLCLTLYNSSKVCSNTGLTIFNITKKNKVQTYFTSNIGEPEFVLQPAETHSFQIRFPIKFFTNDRRLQFELSIDTFNHLNQYYRQYLFFFVAILSDFSISKRIGEHNLIPLREYDIDQQ